MRGNTVRKQVFVYAGIALIIAVAAVLWIVFAQRPADRLFEDGARVNILWIGRGSTSSSDLLALVSVSETDVIFFSMPANVRLHDAAGLFDSAAGLVEAVGAEEAAAAVGTLLGVEIPYTWTCGLDVVSDWIDARDGLSIALDATAVYLDEGTDPAMRIEIRPGTQGYSGAEAVAFATAASAEGDVGLLERQGAFLKALVIDGIAAAELRDVHNAVRADEPAWETNLSTAETIRIADVLHDVAGDDIRVDHLVGEEVEIDGVTYTQPNAVETERLVAALLKGLKLLTPADVSVAVFNGNGVRLMARQTADYLLARGFEISGVRNADSFDYETSYVLVLTDESKAWVLRDALPSNAGAQIVFPDTFASRYEALKDYIPAGTDVVLIAGAGLEIE